MSAMCQQQQTVNEVDESVQISGEYIEQPFEDIFDSMNEDNATDSSSIKMEEPRNSKREPKPKLFSKEFVVESDGHLEKVKKGSRIVFTSYDLIRNPIEE